MKMQNSRIQAPTLLFELEDELALRMGRSRSVIDAIAQLQTWTGTEPYLINLLGCQLIECLPLAVSGEEKRLIDELVQRKIIEDWRQNTAAAHLCEVELALLSYPQIDSLLILYLKVLQRGEAEAEDTPEQSVLIKAGLVILEGSTLKVANAIYAAVFDLAWIEQQVPGLTKPVSIVRSGMLPIEGSRRLDPLLGLPSADDRLGASSPRQPAPETKLYSKTMVLACCMAVAIAILTTYAKESKQPSIAANRPASEPEIVETVTIARRKSVVNAEVEKQLFDSGTEHATNGRWLMAIREFCQIPESSAYFEPAKRNMEKWVALYGEDLAAAKTAFAKESDRACAVMP